ncbi:Nif3-like dinuclear metal center hexameric protein [Paenibacillus athensensis]|nr:Nif3-like dinuclear metal center hexameric protein [Paenibacillus athensensis]MCD1259355.1 Nif3-like dinuclear metal center hexameric protein [Paenibacillus athensensis]
MTVTVQEIVNRLLNPVNDTEPVENTVDTLKYGNPDAPVTKIAVTFTATYEVLKMAVDAGAQLLVTHEPTYFNHRDETDWLQGDPVYEGKKKLIEDSGLAVFRFHDYVHDRYEPDGIGHGMLQALDWSAWADPAHPRLVVLEKPTAVKDVAAHIKSKLDIDSLRLIGSPELEVRRISLFPGAPGGERQIQEFRDYDIELMVAGETHEWETNEYVRDAVALGLDKALLIIGHQKSEEAGMQYAVDLLRRLFPSVETVFLPGQVAFRSI